MILGGHTHTILDQPAVVNNIIVAQAGYGTDQIGRFDMVVDEKTNSIIDWTWELVPITENTAKVDKSLEAYLNGYQDKVDEKYNSIINRFAKVLTHPEREIETSLGNLLADALADNADTDVMMLGSGSIRSEKLGPVVTLGNLKECFPYDDSLSRFSVSGRQLRSIFNHVMRIENRDGEGECFQVNDKVRCTYCDSKKELVELTVKEKEVIDNEYYTITLQSYHVSNSENNLGISLEDLQKHNSSKVVSTSAFQVIEEWLRSKPNVKEKVKGRINYIN